MDSSMETSISANSGIEDIKPVTVSVFTLGPGDTVEITVWRNKDLDKTILVAPDGIISYPFMGNIQVKGLSISQLRNKITAALSEYFVNPRVSVNITSNQSQKIFVLGEVNQPGIFQMAGPTTIIEAISMARGFTRDAKERNVLLIRGDKKKPDLKLLDLKAVLKKGEISQNLSLKPGDVVYVPATVIASVERFFKRIYTVILTITAMEYGIAIEPLVEDVLKGEGQSIPLTIRPKP